MINCALHYLFVNIGGSICGCSIFLNHFRGIPRTKFIVDSTYRNFRPILKKRLVEIGERGFGVSCRFVEYQTAHDGPVWYLF